MAERKTVVFLLSTFPHLHPSKLSFCLSFSQVPLNLVLLLAMSSSRFYNERKWILKDRKQRKEWERKEVGIQLTRVWEELKLLWFTRSQLFRSYNVCCSPLSSHFVQFSFNKRESNMSARQHEWSRNVNVALIIDAVHIRNQWPVCDAITQTSTGISEKSEDDLTYSQLSSQIYLKRTLIVMWNYNVFLICTKYVNVRVVSSLVNCVLSEFLSTWAYTAHLYLTRMVFSDNVDENKMLLNGMYGDVIVSKPNLFDTHIFRWH